MQSCLDCITRSCAASTLLIVGFNVVDLRACPPALRWLLSRTSRCSLPAQEVPAARRLGGSESPKVVRASLHGCLLQFALWFQCSLFRLSELTPRLCHIVVQQVVALFRTVELSDVRPLVIMATACSLSSVFHKPHTHTPVAKLDGISHDSRSDWRAHLPSRSSVRGVGLRTQEPCHDVPCQCNTAPMDEIVAKTLLHVGHGGVITNHDLVAMVILNLSCL